MSHLDEGAVLSLRDRPLSDESLRSHVELCTECQQRLEDARARARAVEALLESLDPPAPDLEAAKRRVRARLDAGPLRGGRRLVPRLGRDLRRAAVILLVATGALSALPGSPLRRLLSSGSAPVHTGPDRAATTLTVTPESAIAVSVPESGIRILLVGATTGTTIEVVWSAGTTARLSAAEGSTFSYADGRLEANVGDGPIRLELPRGDTPTSVELDGRMILDRSEDGLQLFGPVEESSDERILLSVPAG